MSDNIKLSISPKGLGYTCSCVVTAGTLQNPGRTLHYPLVYDVTLDNGYLSVSYRDANDQPHRINVFAPGTWSGYEVTHHCHINNTST